MAGRVFFINKPDTFRPKLTVDDKDFDRRLPGGLPPQPYRNACSKWAGCPTKWAREPFASRQVRGEVMANRMGEDGRYWDTHQRRA